MILIFNVLIIVCVLNYREHKDLVAYFQFVFSTFTYQKRTTN